MNCVLFLDDMDWRHIEFEKIVGHMDDVWLTKAYTARAAIALLDLQHFDQVFLDHDLSEDETGTGMTVVDHILTMRRPPVQIIVHSCNSPAASVMVNRLERHPAGIWVRRIAFPELLTRMHQIATLYSQR